ncbi:MAG: hypothetical protein K2X11_07150 [Acetobacteraceae bacterium]|nr:hypothetical protein [Acetobacteraceae bacterium]
MPRRSRTTWILKISRSNQVTIPAAVIARFGRPTHLELFHNDEMMGLFPCTVMTYEEQAKQAGIPDVVLNEARRILRERAAQAATPPRGRSSPA